VSRINDHLGEDSLIKGNELIYLEGDIQSFFARLIFIADT